MNLDNERNNSNLTVGDILKITREKEGYSIYEVVRSTKIRYSHIYSIENNHYDKLPERTYTLGYIVKYCKFLHLDSNMLIKKAEKEYTLSNPSYQDMVQNNRLDKKYNPINIIKENIIDFIFIIFSLGFKRYNTNNNYNDVSQNKKSKINILWVLLGIILMLIIVVFYTFRKVSNIELAENPITIDSQLTKELDLYNLQIGSYKDKVIDKDNYIIIKQHSKNNQHYLSENNDSNKENVTQLGEVQLTPWPKKNEFSEIKLFFDKNVWVKIYDKYNKNIVYLNKIFKESEYFVIPRADNLVMDVGDYKGLYLMVKGRIVYLDSKFSSNVLRKIPLVESELINKYTK